MNAKFIPRSALLCALVILFNAGCANTNFKFTSPLRSSVKPPSGWDADYKTNHERAKIAEAKIKALLPLGTQKRDVYSFLHKHLKQSAPITDNKDFARASENPLTDTPIYAELSNSMFLGQGINLRLLLEFDNQCRLRKIEAYIFNHY